MLQFDVGTKVRIRRDLKAREVYGGVYANTAMEKLAGTIKKITNKGKSIVGNITYQLSDSDCSWTAEMLEPVNNSYNKITIKIDSRNPNKVIASQEINHNRKEGIAICAPSDKFNFEKGALLALSRLFKNEFDEEELDEHLAYHPLDGWYQCDGVVPHFHQGAIYLFKDSYCVQLNIKNLPAWNKYFKKVELKE